MTGSFIWAKEITSEECSALSEVLHRAPTMPHSSHIRIKEMHHRPSKLTYIICFSPTFPLN